MSIHYLMIHCTILFFAALVPSPIIIPVCNSEPRLLTSRMYATNVTFGVVWSYQQLETELLLLCGVVLSYTISTRNLGRVPTTTGSEHLQINQTSKELSFVSTNVHSGTFVVNVTMNSPQGSHTTTCPTLYLSKYEVISFSC